MNKFVFQAMILSLVLHGTAVSMMYTKKVPYMASLPQFGRSSHGTTEILILKLLKNIEKKLEKQNRLLQDLQSNMVKNSGFDTQSYAVHIAKIEAERKMYEAHPSIEWEWTMKSVRSKTKE